MWQKYGAFVLVSTYVLLSLALGLCVQFDHQSLVSMRVSCDYALKSSVGGSGVNDVSVDVPAGQKKDVVVINKSV